jgi:hypothetical protein
MKVKCKSGIWGWRGHLRGNYDSFGDFKYWCDIRAIHTRLGYKTPETAWRANPLIEGSVNPSDLRRVPRKRKRSVRMTEQQRRDEKNGLFGEHVDIAN